jgi:hypothetical protein
MWVCRSSVGERERAREGGIYRQQVTSSYLQHKEWLRSRGVMQSARGGVGRAAAGQQRLRLPGQHLSQFPGTDQSDGARHMESTV